jgi:hypothetical protein
MSKLTSTTTKKSTKKVKEIKPEIQVDYVFEEVPVEVTEHEVETINPIEETTEWVDAATETIPLVEETTVYQSGEAPITEIVITDHMYAEIAEKLNKGATKSSLVKELLELGCTKSQICKILDMQYPSVFGIEKKLKDPTSVTKTSRVTESLPEAITEYNNRLLETGTTKSDVIRSLLRQGFSRAAIARSMGFQYPMIMGVDKRMNTIKPVDLDKVKLDISTLSPAALEELAIYVTERMAMTNDITE